MKILPIILDRSGQLHLLIDFCYNVRKVGRFSMQVKFVRHGRSVYNELGLFQGQANCPLSQQGLEETILKAKDFSNDFDICFCSPLDRTKQTAQILVPHLEIIYDERLMERALGEFEHTLIDDEKLLFLNSNVPKGGETFTELDARVQSFLEMLKQEYPLKKVLVITHGGFLHAVYRVLQLEDCPAHFHNLEVITVEI